MKRLPIALALITAVSAAQPNAFGAGSKTVLKTPPAKKLESLNKLFSIMHVDKDIDRSWRGLVTTLKLKLIKNLFLEYSKNKEMSRKERFSKAQEDSTRVMNNFSAKMESIYKKKLKQIYVHVYSKYYSSSDLDSLSNFYTSSAGKKATQSSPRLIRESMFKLSRKLRPKVEAIIDEKIDEMFGGVGEEEGDNIVDEIMD